MMMMRRRYPAGSGAARKTLVSATAAKRLVRAVFVQEQTQIIAIANGKPTAKALTIIKVNAKSGFASERTLSIDMSLTPTRR